MQVITSLVVAAFLAGPQTNPAPAGAAEVERTTLAPQGVIVGRVIDEDGNPMAKAPVVWFQYAYVQGKKQLRRLGNSEVLANDQGEYRFANLPAGKYFIAAMITLPNVRTGDVFATSLTQQRNVVTFFPNVIDPIAAIPVEVTVGVELSAINIHVRRVDVYSIRGKAVTGERPAPPVKLELSRTDEVPGPPAMTAVRPDGSFEFPYVSPGSYVMQPASNPAVLMMTDQKGIPPFSGSLDLRITDQNLDDLALQLSPTAGGGINGTVRVEGSDLQAILKPQGTPRSSSDVSTTWSVRPFVALREADENCESAGGIVHPMNEDGTFKIQPVAAKKYSWCVKNLPPGTYVKSARFNDQDVTHKVIDTTNSGGGTLDIVLSTKAAGLTGSVADDKGGPKAGVRVTLWPFESKDGVYETATDQNGSFRLSGVAPGNYYAAAWEELLPPGLEKYPEFLSRFNGDAATVTIEEGGHASQNAKLIPVERIVAEIAKLP